ncbi:MAG: hypothetical protein U1F48_08080 [Burkholderiales bacterium]
MKKTHSRFFACAVIAWALLGLSPPAAAVSVSTTGLGQVLIFPYYTVRPTGSGGSYNTLFTVTNTTPDTKVIRVRFRESRNGREVASLNVYLGPYDSWVGALSATSQGTVLATDDRSCVDPPTTAIRREIAFSNAQYSGAYADGEDTSPARTMEGYFEVFDLGVVKDPNVKAWIAPTPNCFAALGTQLDNSMFAPPSGGLLGTANIISVTDGTLYPYDPTALSGFSMVPLYSVPTSSSPTLADVNPKESVTLDDSGARRATWEVSKGANPADPVSAVLMADQLVNSFVLDAATASATDWVVTMPTKPFYVAVGAATSGSAQPPFESNFAAGGAPDSFGEISFACNTDMNRTLDFDREGRFASGCFVPPPSIPVKLHWAANTIAFNVALLNGYAPTRYSTIFANGWLKLLPAQFLTGHRHQLASTDTPPVVFYGLPMIGFMANDYVNRLLQVGTQTVLSNYSATAQHKVVRRIQP